MPRRKNATLTNRRAPELIPPSGGRLVTPGGRVSPARRGAATSGSPGVHPIAERALSPRGRSQRKISPLDGLTGRDDYHDGVERMRLTNGTLFPIPRDTPVGDFPRLRVGDNASLAGGRNRVWRSSSLRQCSRVARRGKRGRVFFLPNGVHSPRARRELVVSFQPDPPASPRAHDAGGREQWGTL